MRAAYAKLSLPGHRSENQDRVEVLSVGDSLLLLAVDGMGGHAHGAKAAEVTIRTLRECFNAAGAPIFDPQGFLTLALARAHENVVEIGADVAIEHRPRATCAACLVQDGGTYWAHVGDSRVYHLRAGVVQTRTRDHSHVELLLREGLIGEQEMRGHPMRNFVECCLGGDAPLPDMSSTARRALAPGDVLVVCTDGLWSGIEDSDLGAAFASQANGTLDTVLRALADRAISRNAPYSDNPSVAALRWHGA